MRNIFGNALTLTIFGESHGECVGGVIDGLPAGLEIDMDYIMWEMTKRKSTVDISTTRNEDDVPLFLSGIKDGFTEGTSVAFIIPNKNARPSDYNELQGIARPGHADYAAQAKYEGYQDASGGGHFSGRLTSVMVTAGAILKKALQNKGILVSSHIKNLNGIEDADFDWNGIIEEMLDLNDKEFAVLDEEKGSLMIERIKAAREEQDSVGGVLETVVYGVPAGTGEPLFTSIESEIAQAMFSIGAIKGIQFGKGFDFATMKGSEANDPFYVEDDMIFTRTNNNGGINGGISNGMPIVFQTVVKPTPSIGKVQQTVNFETMENVEIKINGRHDPAIIHRARTVVDCMTAFVLADLLVQRYGNRWLV